jgi:competence protein ComEA
LADNYTHRRRLIPETRAGKIWTAVILLLILIIVAGGVILWLRRPHSSPIEITLAASPDFAGQIYLDGAVNSPGYYPYQPGDNIGSLLQAAGGTTDGADLTNIRLYVPASSDTFQAQKIDINRAESWLLEAIPGIGEVLAGRIIEYREANGPFQNINALTQVEGITVSLFEKIKPHITVTEYTDRAVDII